MPSDLARTFKSVRFRADWVAWRRCFGAHGAGERCRWRRAPLELRRAWLDGRSRCHLQRVADQALSLVPGADGALVGLVSGYHVVYVCGSGYLSEHLDTHTLLDASIGGLAVRTASVQRSDDTDRDPRVDQAAASSLKTRSTVCVPLARDADVFGVLAVGSMRPRAFSDRDVDVLRGWPIWLGWRSASLLTFGEEARIWLASSRARQRRRKRSAPVGS